MSYIITINEINLPLGEKKKRKHGSNLRRQEFGRMQCFNLK